jgi:predicted RNA methylase
MSQRASGYARRANEDYPTPARVTKIIAEHLRVRERVRTIWEPAAGNGALAAALKDEGFRVVTTADDFLSHTKTPEPVDCICTNPPYGDDRRGVLACDFIRHALKLEVRTVAMLLRVDFDSGKARRGLFRDCPAFAGKIVLLDRIKWFDGPSSPSDNHAWFVWNRAQKWAPWIASAEAAQAVAARAAA